MLAVPLAAFGLAEFLHQSCGDPIELRGDIGAGGVGADDDLMGHHHPDPINGNGER